MPTGIGIDAITQGGTVIGRSALDDRLLVRSEYHRDGIVCGCKITLSPTSMGYVIGNGDDPVSVAVSSRGGSDGATKFIVPTGPVPTSPGPASGKRCDVLWAKQNDPSKGDADNQAIVGVAQSVAASVPPTPDIPAGAIALAYIDVPAGAAKGTDCMITDLGNYAIPYGASLGTLYRYVDKFNGKPPQTRTTKGSGSFTVPTERYVDLVLRPTISTPATDNEGSVLYRFLFDGQEVGAIECGFNRFWQTYHLTMTVLARPGRHTVAYTQERRAKQSHMSDFVQRYGTNAGNTYLGTTFTVEDRGVA